MNENRISLSLADTEIAEINQAIAILSAKLQPFSIALEANDKKSLAKSAKKACHL
jgi:hypothetical protein